MSFYLTARASFSLPRTVLVATPRPRSDFRSDLLFRADRNIRGDSAPIPALRRPRRPRRTISWKAIFTAACLTLVWCLIQPGTFLRAHVWLTDLAVAAEDANPSPFGDDSEFGMTTDDQTGADASGHGNDSHGDDHAEGHKDPVAEVLLAIVIILF